LPSLPKVCQLSTQRSTALSAGGDAQNWKRRNGSQKASKSGRQSEPSQGNTHPVTPFAGPTEKDNGRMNKKIIVYKHSKPTHFVLKQNHIASEHSTDGTLSEKIRKNLSSCIRPENQPTTPVDKRAYNRNIFWYSACVRMIRMAIMQELVSTVS